MTKNSKAGDISASMQAELKGVGGKNVTSSTDAAYPKVIFQQSQKWDAEVIFICGSDRSYLSKLKEDQRWESLRAVRNNKLYQFDCGLTCRTNSRIVDMAELLFQTIYGEAKKS